MKNLLTTVALALFATTASYAQCTTKGGYYAAISKDYLEKLISYSVDDDTQAIQKLIDAGVVFGLKAGVTVYLEDTSWGKAEIRPKGMTQTVWTVTEAVNCR